MKLIKLTLLTALLIFSGCSLNQPKTASSNVDSIKTQCEGGNLESCDKLGGMYQSGQEVEKDFSKALDIFAKNCEKGYAKSCSSAAFFLRIGLGTQRDEKTAFGLYNIGCKGGDARGCNEIAEALMRGTTLQKNEKLAKEFFEKGINLSQKQCDGGDVYACMDIGTKYAYGKVEKDFDKALYYFDMACKKGEKLSCTYQKNIKAEMAKVKKLESLCKNGNVTSCRDIASEYESGTKIKQDKSKAKLYYTKACKGGNKFSCLSLALIQGGKKGMSKIKNLCDGGYAMACRNLAYKYMDKNDKKNVFKYFNKACDLGDSLSCNQIGK